mmetsp:Transcript_17906/g.45134  ORF Transcript_17906/g.45134 Transcript_17906/m.45134 type:complete len:152 (+) Transcript_17906:405-860(+)
MGTATPVQDLKECAHLAICMACHKLQDLMQALTTGAPAISSHYAKVARLFSSGHWCLRLARSPSYQASGATQQALHLPLFTAASITIRDLLGQLGSAIDEAVVALVCYKGRQQVLAAALHLLQESAPTVWDLGLWAHVQQSEHLVMPRCHC